jgi:outer membrane autotransporter protein
MALKEGNPLTHHAPASGDKDHGWDPFAGVDAGLFWTNKGSRNKYRTFTFITGVARQVYFPDHDTSFLVAGFIDGGFASYDVKSNYGILHGSSLDGDGSLRYIGGGLMARQRWDNGFRLEASARTGKIENKFSAMNITLPTGEHLHYDMETPYYALHFGIGHEWSLSEDSELDVLLRYFWTKQDSSTVRFSTGDKVDFDDNISQIVRLGARYTKLKSDRFSYYLGAAYEHEFDTKTRGFLNGHPLNVPSLKGSTGIAEIGVIFRSTEDRHFNIETGLQGHFGVRRGISGGVRLGWEF